MDLKERRIIKRRSKEEEQREMNKRNKMKDKTRKRDVKKRKEKEKKKFEKIITTKAGRKKKVKKTYCEVSNTRTLFSSPTPCHCLRCVLNTRVESGASIGAPVTGARMLISRVDPNSVSFHVVHWNSESPLLSWYLCEEEAIGEEIKSRRKRRGRGRRRDGAQNRSV